MSFSSWPGWLPHQQNDGASYSGSLAATAVDSGGYGIQYELDAGTEF